MFSLSLVFVLISQISTANSQFFCRTCPTRNLNLSSDNSAEPIGCNNSNVSNLICWTELDVNYTRGQAMVKSGGCDAPYGSLNGKSLIKGVIRILPQSRQPDRSLQIYCFNNQSCLSEINDTYIKGNCFRKAGWKYLFHSDSYMW